MRTRFKEISAANTSSAGPILFKSRFDSDVIAVVTDCITDRAIGYGEPVLPGAVEATAIIHPAPSAEFRTRFYGALLV